MNKKSIILITIAILLVAIVAAIILLSGNGQTSSPQSGGQGSTLSQSGSVSDSTGDTLSGESQGSTVDLQQQPTASVQIGVGEYKPGDYGESEQDTTASTQKPEPSNPDVTTPTEKPTTPPTSEPQNGFRELTWEEYDALDTAGQMAYMDQFASAADFVAWFNKAKADAEKDSIIIGGDGVIDLSGTKATEP